MLLDSILILIGSFSVFFIVCKHSINRSFLIDADYKKKQSFHNEIKSNSGGLSIVLILASINLFKIDSYNIILIFPLFFFMIGFMDDLKIITSPFIRFFIIIFFIMSFILTQNFYVENFELPIFNDYLNEIALVTLTIIGFFLVINGANLVDGFNGLLSIHSLIIILIISTIFRNDVFFDKYLLTSIILVLIVFLFFNLVSQKLFLGDSGAYLLGSLIPILVIESSNKLENFSPFFFAIILFYLYFETLFSVIRKIYEKKNPFKPDQYHLHMLLYKYLKNFNISYPNNLTGIIINLFFIVLILPTILFFDQNLICVIYFIFLHFIYLIVYKVLREKK